MTATSQVEVDRCGPHSPRTHHPPFSPLGVGGGCSPSPTTTPLAASPTGNSHQAHNQTPGQRKARPGRLAHQSLWPCSHSRSHRVGAQVLNNQSVMQPIKCPGPNCSGVGHRPQPQTPCVPPAQRLLTSGTRRKVETSQFSPPANCGFIREPGCRDQSRGSHAAPSHLPSCQKDRGPGLPVHRPGSEVLLPYSRGALGACRGQLSGPHPARDAPVEWAARRRAHSLGKPRTPRASARACGPASDIQAVPLFRDWKHGPAGTSGQPAVPRGCVTSGSRLSRPDRPLGRPTERDSRHSASEGWGQMGESHYKAGKPLAA